MQSLAEDNVRQGLESVETRFDREKSRAHSNNASWPGFFFPLADPSAIGPLPLSMNGTDFSGMSLELDKRDNPFDDALEQLVVLLEAALDELPDTARPELTLPDPDATNPGSAWFTIRCVYERPNCGPRSPTLVSAPSEAFEMASFFDPQAPARAARIPMPFDISPGGLRKFNKSATLAVSDMLCAQIKRIRKLTLGDLVLSVLPWPFHKDLPSVGPAGS
jgi:hypothetical protein